MAADLHVFTDGSEWWVAASLAHALELQREECGFEPEDQTAEEWRQLPDEEQFAIREDEDSEEITTRTCVEWAVEHGPGFLCGESS